MQHRHNRDNDAEQHVEADEELVDEASIRLGVEDEEQHDSNKWQDVVEDCDCEQSWKPKGRKGKFRKQKSPKTFIMKYRSKQYLSNFKC